MFWLSNNSRLSTLWKAFLINSFQFLTFCPWISFRGNNNDKMILHLLNLFFIMSQRSINFSLISSGFDLSRSFVPVWIIKISGSFEMYYHVLFHLHVQLMDTQFLLMIFQGTYPGFLKIFHLSQ